MDRTVNAPARKKLPAYGKQLLLARRAGQHPLVVHLVFGNRWRQAGACTWPGCGPEHPLLALTPQDYAPGLFNFSVLTGLQVALFDQDAHGATKDGPLHLLMGEVAQWSAEVEVISPAFERVEAAHILAYQARDYRHFEDAEKNHGWPCWWSAEIESVNGKRRQTWSAAAAERREPEPAASV
jgi:hypothetical protein